LRGLFGEFFPPTPQIPGAVIVGLQPMSFDPQQYGNCGPNEYDMPQAGTALWLMAEQAEQLPLQLEMVSVLLPAQLKLLQAQDSRVVAVCQLILL